MTSVLALETSCDESAAALVCRHVDGKFEVRSARIASQVEEHARWGGVVPEIASRRHVEALPGLIQQVLEESDSTLAEVDAIAATVTPGLAGALMVASVTGRTLSALHDRPFLAVHHLEGHLASVHLAERRPQLPYLVLLVSGGHTELIRVEADGAMQRLGRSHDDAAGEAFDKVARLLGLGYPGGPAIQAAAEGGDGRRFKLPKGRISLPEGGFHPYDFSFSGLKTAMLRTVEAQSGPLPTTDLAASFEQVVVDVLVERSLRCAMDHGLEELVMVGGVAANRRLRQTLEQRSNAVGVRVSVAPLSYCTDNAAMIGAAALLRWDAGARGCSLRTGVSARWPLAQVDLLYNEQPAF
jgi:N6-L-threonylcarbamoyladenine synthase